MLEKRVEHWSKKWMQQGLEQGILQGMEKGMEQGMEKGVEKGKLEGEAAVLERQLIKRFGPLDETIQQKLKAATLEQLETWTDRILDAARIGDVFGAH